ncbi:MAG: hypothetical protein QW051_00955 [Candidatus Aenigmatarchaeota archaeon]
MKISKKGNIKNMKEKVKKLLEKILEEIDFEIEELIEDSRMMEEIMMNFLLYTFDDNEIPKIFNLSLIDNTKKYKILDENGFWIFN